MGKSYLFLILCFIGLLISTGLSAQWVQNGVPIVSETYDQIHPKAVSDEAGGAIFVWKDNRSAAPGIGIYIQRIDGWGNVLWTVNGVPVKTPYMTYYYPEIAPDGKGGAIVVWGDDREGNVDLYAQRIGADGTAQWTEDGILICDWPTTQINYAVIADGAGGAIIAWEDDIFGSADIFAQRIDEDGSPLWTADGIDVCTSSFDQNEPALATDGVGGAIIAWDDHRGGPSDIYAQRIDGSGAAMWTANGKVICNAVNTQYSQCIVADSWGGAIIAWLDYRNSANPIVWAQRINRYGTILWTPNGIAASTTVENMYTPAIVSDGRNGAIITWSQVVGLGQDILAQRMSYLGNREWSNSGAIVCSSSQVQKEPAIVADGALGAVIAWQDYRSGSNRDIYAQKISGDGLPVWNINGISVCTEGSDQVRVCAASDGVGGAIFAWEDYRPGSSADVYAQRIERCGNWGYPSPTITSVADVPSDQGGQVTVTWDKSRIETVMAMVIDQYSVWRMLPVAQFQALLARGEKGIDPAVLGRYTDTAPTISGDAPASEPIYYISMVSGAATGWELLDHVDATNSPTYSDQVSTLFDYTPSDPGTHYFMVIAHGSDHFDFWESRPDSGCSIDNIPPSQPSEFSGSQSYEPPGLFLAWGAGGLSAPSSDDFSHYALYRDVLPDFETGPDNRIYEGVDAEYFDDEWRWDSGFYYMVRTVDIHGNESGAAFLGPYDITGDETHVVPAVTYLTQNIPNPFNPSTTIQFGLASRELVTLSIYDVSGRLVRTLVNEPREAGLYTQSWDGRSAKNRTVASGVYFYRLRAGTFSETKKMILTR